MDGWNTMEYDRYDRFREGKCHSSSVCSPRDSPRQNELHRRGGDGGGEVSSTSLFRGRFLNGEQTARKTQRLGCIQKDSSIEIFRIFFKGLKIIQQDSLQNTCVWWGDHGGDNGSHVFSWISMLKLCLEPLTSRVKWKGKSGKIIAGCDPPEKYQSNWKPSPKWEHQK